MTMEPNQRIQSAQATSKRILAFAREQLIIQLGYLVKGISGGETQVPDHLSHKIGTIRTDFMQDLQQDRVVFLDRDGKKIPHSEILSEHILFLINNFQSLQKAS